MSKYDSLKDLQSAPAEQKLAVLRPEFLGEISHIKGYAALIKASMKESSVVSNLPAEWSEWAEQIIVASENMKELLLLMTSNPE